VRNEPDGTVSGEAEGPETALEAFRIRLARGPAFATVERLDWEGLDMRSSLPFPFDLRR
jgi:acylphosphatase